MITWKPIPGFSRYEASSDGQLRSLNYKNSGKIKILKPALDKKGYLKTMLLSDNGKYKSWCIHTFIALAFFGTRPPGYTIDHIDCNKQNNSITNIEYVTRSENMIRGYRNGLIKLGKGEDHHSAKLTESQVKEIRDYVKKNAKVKSNGSIYGYGRKQLAEKYGISEAHVKDIINKRRNIWSCA